MYGKSSEKFKCSCNLYVIKVGNNLEITSVRSSLDLGNKIWIGKPFIDTVFVKKLHVYMLLKEHVDFLTKLCILSKCDWMFFKLVTS